MSALLTPAEIAGYYLSLQDGKVDLTQTGRIDYRYGKRVWYPGKSERGICCTRVKDPSEYWSHCKSLVHVLTRYAGGTDTELAVEVRLEIEQQRTVARVVARLKGEKPESWDDVPLPPGEYTIDSSSAIFRQRLDTILRRGGKP